MTLLSLHLRTHWKNCHHITRMWREILPIFWIIHQLEGKRSNKDTGFFLFMVLLLFIFFKWREYTSSIFSTI